MNEKLITDAPENGKHIHQSYDMTFLIRKYNVEYLDIFSKVENIWIHLYFWGMILNPTVNHDSFHSADGPKAIVISAGKNCKLDNLNP